MGIVKTKKLVGLTVLVIPVAILSAWGYDAFTDEPLLPASIANGTYENRYGGPIVLKNGMMTFQGVNMSYEVRQDRIGAYVAPSLIIATDLGENFTFTYEGIDNNTKFRIDDPKDPQNLKFFQRFDRGNRVFTFVRKNGS
jgi:hypothetical protein